MIGKLLIIAGPPSASPARRSDDDADGSKRIVRRSAGEPTKSAPFNR
jgi:hypothetical protein